MTDQERIAALEAEVNQLDAENTILVTALLEAAARVDIETGLRESANRFAGWWKHWLGVLDARLASANRRAKILTDAADLIDAKRTELEDELLATNEAIANLCHLLEHFCPADVVEVEVIVGEEPRVGTRQGLSESGIAEGA